MGPEATQFHKTLAQKIAEKTGERYDDVTRLMRIKISFLVLRASMLCIRGSRTLRNIEGERCEDFALTLNEIGLRETTTLFKFCSISLSKVIYNDSPGMIH